MSTLVALLRATGKAHGDRTAFVEADTGHSVSFADFWERSVAGARTLAAAMSGPGPIAVLGRNSVEWARWEAATAIAGRACLPVNFRLSVEEIDWQLRHAEAAGLVHGPEFTETAERLRALGHHCLPFAVPDAHPPGPLPSVGPQDIQRIMYTSATTGAAKGVLTPHQRIVDNVVTTLANQLSDATADSCYLVATPLTHMAVGYLWPMVAVGARSVLLDRFTPAGFCAAVERHQVTHTLLVPTMVAELAEHLADDPDAVARLVERGLRAIWFAGAPTSQGARDRATRVLGGLLNEQYGLTELWSSHRSMCATYMRYDWGVDKPGSCGRPLIGAEIAVVDDAGAPLPTGEVGELVVRSAGAVAGYLGDPEATTETFADGWTRTGDLARIDDDGYVYIVDRKKDVIISGGFNIYSAELENALSAHPRVLSCAAVPVPHPRWGETPWMFATTDGEVAEEELAAHLTARLSRYKQPSRIVVVDRLPLGPTGKILKRRLRAIAESARLDGAPR
ncbi:AMP-binding protein [Pseudonocardia sp. NPDC049635]|uniref:class I adenylate-forming enzyme family protein n=1 Tax=Pseudonocardia sp. NPDC049635 TaxID=3155506 RepID=UPI0033E050FE